MSFKKESPARPPPPKVGKKASSSPTMKFSFKSLEKDEDDEEDLTVLTGELDKKVESERLKNENKTLSEKNENKTLSDKKEETSTRKDVGESKKSVPTQRSWDSPSHSVTSHKDDLGPSRSASDNKLQRYSSKSVDEDSTAISWLRQNVAEISSAVKDKAEKARKRIEREFEEFSENHGKEEESKEKEMKSVSPEQKKSIPMKEKEEDNLPTEKKIEVKEKLNIDEVDTADADVEESNNAKEMEAFHIVDDFYSNEPSEDFTGIPSSGRTDSLLAKKTKMSLKRRIVKAKVPKLQTPVSMSKLSKDKVDELEESTNKFFDVNDETATDDSLYKSVNETSKLKNITEHVEKHVPVKKLIGLIGLILFYLIVPMPSYISGMIMGSFLASLGWISYLFITKASAPKDIPKMVPFKELPPMIEPEIKDVSLDDDVTVYKGWMNEIEFYNPDTYHINNTHSVHVYLDGITLRLRRPKVGIPKRAMWDEEIPKSNEFVHQRYFNLEGGRIFLMPPGLVKKRIWSKKYPLCIALKDLGRKQIADVNESLPESDQGFEIVSDECCDSSVLYLFARTNHEKEEWYKRLNAACKGTPLKRHLVEVKKFFVNRKSAKFTTSLNAPEVPQQHKRQSSVDSPLASVNSASTPLLENFETESRAFDIEEFIRYMGRTMPKEYYSHFVSPYKRNPVESKDSSYQIDCEPQLLWLNAVISRCSWDFLHQKYWADKIMDKLQKKLDKIHIPYFIEAFKITDINLGAEMPVIRRAAAPFLDNQGFWVDLDVNYGGGFKMTIVTKVNLMKLKKASKEDVKNQKETKERSAVTNSEEEDSAESSTDEEEEILPQGNEDSQATGGKTSRKWMKYLKKITESKYFQSATEMKYVKKAMEEVSNTPLVLSVELRFLSGVLAINIPPPPTDRIWYGFRGNPKLTLVAKPKVGERRVTVSHITDFIEKKLAMEFQRVLVMPNLDDLVIPLLLPEYEDIVPDAPITRTASSLSSPV